MARAASRKKTDYGKEKTPDYAAIGEMLQETRAGYGLELEQVAYTLHVKPTVVVALEKGRLEDIPGGLVYAKGHLRTYAQYLGINLATMLSLLTVEAEVKPIASVSSSHQEPRRTRMAAMLSLLALLVAAGVWFAISNKAQGPEVSLVKPVPEALNAHFDAIESVMLSSPCIKETEHTGWPACYQAEQEREWRNVLPQPLVSVMQVK